MDVADQICCRRLPSLRGFGDGAPAAGEVVFILPGKIGDGDVLEPPPDAVAHLPVPDDARRGDDRGVGVGEVNLFDLPAEADAQGPVRDLVQAVEQQERLALAEAFPEDGLEGDRLNLRHLRLAQGVAQYVVQ